MFPQMTLQSHYHVGVLLLMHAYIGTLLVKFYSEIHTWNKKNISITLFDYKS